MTSAASGASGAAAPTAASYLEVRGSRGLALSRTPVIKTGVVKAASGSAFLESDNTKVICAVYGPKQSSHSEYSESGVLTCSLRFAPFALDFRRRRARVSPEEVQISAALQEALSVCVQLAKFPKLEVAVEVMVLERGGGELSAAIACASAALADSGVEMFDLVGAATASYVKGVGVVADPSQDELSHPLTVAQVTVGYMPSLRQVTFLQQAGKLLPQQVGELTEQAVVAADAGAGTLRTSLAQAAHRALAAEAAVAVATEALAADTRVRAAAATAKAATVGGTAASGKTG